MKVFYIACNPGLASELALEREITELQRRATYASGEPIQFVFFPSLSVEQLPIELSRGSPDVVHFSAHGDSGELLLANANDTPVKISGDMLREFLRYDRPPNLVYFNACNSASLAKAVVGVVPSAIGTTALVTNRTARASAVVFYDRLLSGSTVKDAFEAGRRMMEAMQDNAVSSIIECADGYDASSHRLHVVPRIVARGVPPELKFTRQGFVTLELKLIGCPSNTAQVVFFTDDKGFILNDPDDDESDADFLARELCQIVRDAPRRGLIESDGVWTTCEDFRVYACGTTAGGQTFTVASTVCDALLDYGRYVRHYPPGGLEAKRLHEAVTRLRDPDQSLDTARGIKLDGSVASPIANVKRRVLRSTEVETPRKSNPKVVPKPKPKSARGRRLAAAKKVA